MTYQSVWYYTQLPKSIVDIFCEELIINEMMLKEATVGNRDDLSILDESKRKSKVSWTSKNNWINGFCYHYILEANLANFNYDIYGFQHQEMQYTVYNEGEYYGWHFDDELTADMGEKNDLKRKLSFSLQLSNPDDYDGGNMQIRSFEDTLYEVPKERGVIVIFDSRARHRVTKVKSGCRKSLVGWVGGPRWK